jgi:hypothetical protein
MAALFVSSASANIPAASFNCTSATLSYTDFPNATTASPNVVSETVLADGSTVLYGLASFSFTGTAASRYVSGSAHLQGMFSGLRAAGHVAA